MTSCFGEEAKKQEQPKNAEVEKIDARLAKLTQIWREDTGVINSLTNFKRTPVQRGTQAYFKCLESSKRIQQAEAEAAALKRKKSEILKVGSRDIDQKSVGDAALAKMTAAEKLEMLEKLKREVGSNNEPFPDDTESKNSNDAQGVDKSGIQTDEIKPQDRPTLDNLSPLRKKLVGYWISTKKLEHPPTYDLDKGVTEDDLGEEAKLAKRITENMSYGYSCYGPDAFWINGDWVPYDEIKENGDTIEIKYTFKNSQFKRTLERRIKIRSENEIVEVNPGGELTYGRISEKDWTGKTEGVEWIIEDEMLEITSKMPLPKPLQR